MFARRLRLASVLLLVVALASSAALAAGCGDDDDDNGASASPTTAARATTAASPTSGATQPAGTAPAGDTAVLIASSSLGQILTDPEGFTLYTFDNDTPGSGTSACSGGCATNWPPNTTADEGPLTGPAGLPGELETITRDDGALQVTYNGSPLYRFSGDTVAGQTNGDGFGGIWHAAQP